MNPFIGRIGGKKLLKKQIVDKISEWSINGSLHAKEIAAEYFYLIEKLN